jgi:hypothetical protein
MLADAFRRVRIATASKLTREGRFLRQKLAFRREPAKADGVLLFDPFLRLFRAEKFQRKPLTGRNSGVRFASLNWKGEVAERKP